MTEDTSPRQSMRTLSRWRHLLKVPLTIDCPSMKIIGHDFEEPVFTGSGQIHIRSRTEMDFVMHATPRDSGEAFKKLAHAQQNPYDVLGQFRLLATQYDGTEWNAGWTTLRVGETLGNICQLSGPISSLVTATTGHFIAPTSGIEVIYTPKLRLPLSSTMTTSIQRDGVELLRKMERGGKTVEVAGTRIDFFVDPEFDATWAVAATSNDFCHPYAENWVSQPLRLLLGQLVFPRLVARNFGDRATIWLRPSPPIKMDTLAASILQKDPLGAHGRFWEVYCQTLTMIAQARGEDGGRNFEAHPLTRYYHEVIQATHGSNWMWCLTVASAIEGIAKLFVSEATPSSSYAAETISSLKEHVQKWDVDLDLQGRVLGLLEAIESDGNKAPKSVGTGEILRRLVSEGTINKAHRDVWKFLRNRVAHGELVSPWSEQELEERMRLLTELMHRLSMKYIEQHSM